MFYTFVTLHCKFKNVLASDRTKCLFLREYFFFKLSPTVLDLKKNTKFGYRIRIRENYMDQPEPEVDLLGHRTGG